jgi:hypothetical protein
MNECLVKEKTRLEQKELELREMVQNKIMMFEQESVQVDIPIDAVDKGIEIGQ